MDSISSQVEFRFTISEASCPDPRLVASKNRKVLADVEGFLTICVNGRPIFEEPGVLLMELGLDLVDWLRDMRSGHVRNFQYVSIDYADGPLVGFVQDGEERWSLESPWMNGPVLAGGHSIVSAAERYVEDLATQLRRRYGIELSDYHVEDPLVEP
ncbi:MAG TPA: hypothetical protein VD969_23295 [Symbiobacteriaceae bacterium]|nr:hypothetical protein [Symbiobacteriaceae bacterium]